MTTPSAIILTKTASSSFVMAGKPISFTITVTNISSAAFTNLELKETMPTDTRFISIQSSDQGFVTTTPSIGGNGIISIFAASFAAGASATFILVFCVDPSTTSASLSNNVTATAISGVTVVTSTATDVVI